MKREAWAAAAEWWRRLITVDELDERAYRGLMTCHGRLGERSQVQQLYQRLEQALGKQLQAQPEPTTQQLFRTLIATAPPRL
jgi:DNA-binding SARP family transcriptional activator